MTGPPFSDSILFCFIFFPSEQKCRVDDDKNGTGIVYESADDRIENTGDCQNDGDKIQRHRKCQVQTDDRHHSF